MSKDETTACEDCAGTGTEWVRTDAIRAWVGKDIPCRTCCDITEED